MIDRLDAALEHLNRLYLRLAQVILAGLVAIVFGQVVYRYLFGKSFLGISEITAFSIVWVVFMMAVVLHRRRRHIVITALVDHMGGSAKRAAAALVSLGTIAFSVFVYAETVHVWPYLTVETPVFHLHDVVFKTAPLFAFGPILLQEIVNLARVARPRNGEPSHGN